MPGGQDPAEKMLPQQPIRAESLFSPQLFRYTTFTTVSNPYLFNVNDLDVLVTSGQPLSDCARYALKQSHDRLDRLSLAVKMLRWRHIAPTAPDTLWCHPYTDSDPFVLTSLPHIYVCGNQPEFASAMVHGDSGQKVRVVLLPEFRKVPTLVLIRLDDPEWSVQEVKFTSLLPDDVKRRESILKETREDQEEQFVAIEHGMDDED